MRERLAPYKQEDALNYLCVLATELLRLDSLAQLVPLLAGFDSVRRTLSPAAAQAVENLRAADLAPNSRREMVILVDTYNRYHDRRERELRDGTERRSQGRQQFDRRYRVTDDLRVAPRWSSIVPPDIQQALDALTRPLAVAEREIAPAHDPFETAEIKDPMRGYEAVVEPLGFIPPDPPRHSVTRIGRAPGLVRWNALVAVADEFDQLDVAAGRQKDGARSWHRRLHDASGERTAQLLSLGREGLEPTDGILLDGVKHLIGLPGAGKTTLLYLLAGYLQREGFQACFLFPSIEVATAFVETLDRYRVPVGLLYGRGESTRARHALNFATSMANQNGGFGVTRPTANYFATNCALAGFASDEDVEFPHDKPPCLSVMQAGSGRKQREHRCALASVCGFQLVERDLVRHHIWAGHILSLDRPVSKLFSEKEISHFEYVAHHFDLLVVDEADGAQASMDQRGTPIMRLTGSEESLWSTLISDLHKPAAAGRNAFVGGESLPAILSMTGRFGTAAERLVARISHFSNEFRRRYANNLLTSLSILADIFQPDRNGDQEETDAHNKARAGIEMLWDLAARQVAFRFSPRAVERDAAEEDEETTETDDRHVLWDVAEHLGTSFEEARDYYSELVVAIELWERDGDMDAVREVAKVLRRAPSLESPHDDETFIQFSALLVASSMVVLQHFGLAPHLRRIHAEGLVSDRVFESRMRRDMKAIVPESLVGRLSGVRYTIGELGDIEVTQIGFEGTPRLLPERMQQLAQGERGLAVLLTSATSMLEQSPTFHVNAGPHYVLQRPNAGHGWKDSRYALLPLPDPANPTRALRFSGAGINRQDDNLNAMVDHLLRGEASRVSLAMAANDVVDGIGRKAAFVVNSYAQCELIYNHISVMHPAWRSRVRYLKRATLHGINSENAVTAAEVESLGWDSKWDLLIFPMAAIGRGVNIVFPEGPRANQAVIGSLYFMTRPHPRSESLQLIQGLVARDSERFDKMHFASTEAAVTCMQRARRETMSIARQLLRMPLMVQALGSYAEPFVADQMIQILQTIGRAMRGDCPAFVYFVDAAWAPKSAAGEPDTANSSMLVMMQDILDACLEHPEPAVRECYQNLYLPFAEPLGRVENLLRTGRVRRA